MVPAFIPVDQATERGLENAIYRARCVCFKFERVSLHSSLLFVSKAVCAIRCWDSFCVCFFSFCAACSLFASIAFMSVVCPGFADLVRGGQHVPVRTPSLPSGHFFLFFWHGQYALFDCELWFRSLKTALYDACDVSALHCIERSPL